MRAAFRWRLPSRYNIAEHVCERHVGATRPALICPDPAGGDSREWSFRELSRLSNRLANALAAGGVRRGDRVAVLLGQGVETGLAHLAAYKLGAVALPLFALFGAEAIEHRLRDSGAKALITDAEGREKAEALDLPELCLTVAEDFWDLLDRGSDEFDIAATGPDDPALLMYTSGTTGPPKGALHGHRVLPGHPAGRRPAARILPPARRPVLDARRLGLGGRSDGRIAAGLGGGCAGSGPAARQVRPGRGLCGPRAPRRPQRLPPADGAQDDAAGLPGRSPVRPCPAERRQRRGERGRGAAGLGEGGLRADDQRVLRPDRVQSGARQLRRAVSGQARLAGPSDPRPRGRGARRRRTRIAARRDG